LVASDAALDYNQLVVNVDLFPSKEQQHMNEYDAMADQIAFDIGPVVSVTIEEAYALARLTFPIEPREVIEGVAEALYRSYEVCYFRCRKGTVVSGPHFQRVNAVDRGDAIEKLCADRERFFAGADLDLHWQYVEPVVEEDLE
jgi:hypothetical protein